VTHTPNDRGACGNVIWTAGVTPARCTQPPDHPGWHQNDEGMSWNLGPCPPAAGDDTRPLILNDVADLGDLASAKFAERFRQALAQPQRITVLPLSESDLEQAAYERGGAEGRRQATEGWERQWAVAHVDGGWVYPYESEVEARAHCRVDWHHVVSRLVGPWEPAGQTQAPCRTEVLESRSAGWVFRCHTCDITTAGLDETTAKHTASVHLNGAEQDGDGRG
jgi:hypothetical protein